jgi:hypothetical protein
MMLFCELMPYTMSDLAVGYATLAALQAFELSAVLLQSQLQSRSTAPAH